MDRPVIPYGHRPRRLKRSLLCGLVRRYPRFDTLLPAVAPVNVRRLCLEGHPELIVFLPGIGDVLEDFELNGFADAVRESSTPADLVVADVHFGYDSRRWQRLWRMFITRRGARA